MAPQTESKVPSHWERWDSRWLRKVRHSQPRNYRSENGTCSRGWNFVLVLHAQHLLWFWKLGKLNYAISTGKVLEFMHCCHSCLRSFLGGLVKSYKGVGFSWDHFEHFGSWQYERNVRGSVGTILRIVETKCRVVQAWWSQKSQRQVVWRSVAMNEPCFVSCLRFSAVFLFVQLWMCDVHLYIFHFIHCRFVLRSLFLYMQLSTGELILLNSCTFDEVGFQSSKAFRVWTCFLSIFSQKKWSGVFYTPRI